MEVTEAAGKTGIRLAGLHVIQIQNMERPSGPDSTPTEYALVVAMDSLSDCPDSLSEKISGNVSFSSSILLINQEFLRWSSQSRSGPSIAGRG